MELWDVYDRDRILTGKQMNRGDPFEENAYHLVIHVCLFNSAGEMLIQQRQESKEDWKNMWDVTVGGSAITGETSQQAAEREVLEEIGLSLDLQDVRPTLTMNFENGFDDFYLIEKDIHIENLPIPTEEVKEVKWAAHGENINMIAEGIFLPYHESLIELLFDLRFGMGSHNKR